MRAAVTALFLALAAVKIGLVFAAELSWGIDARSSEATNFWAWLRSPLLAGVLSGLVLAEGGV